MKLITIGDRIINADQIVLVARGTKITVLSFSTKENLAVADESGAVYEYFLNQSEDLGVTDNLRAL